MTATPPCRTGHDPTPGALIGARAALRMHVRDGLLLDGVPLAHIARDLGTPTWVYGADTLRARARTLAAALQPAHVHLLYAVKANDHLAILTLLAREGVGADVVSGGELARAIAAGMDPRTIVFSGVGKTHAELVQALSAEIGQINVESAEEQAMLSAVARSMNRVATIALRINPDIDAGTHDKISTGRAGDKFGVTVAAARHLYAAAAADPALNPVGLALHIGSQIDRLAPYRAAYARAADLVHALRGDGLTVERMDCGGGLAIAYRSNPAASPTAYAGMVAASLGALGLTLMVEPGRWLVGPAGVLLSRVVRVKRADPHPIVVLDAAMNDLLRPALYDAWHGMVALSPTSLHRPLTPFDVVGPVCESSDVFARRRLLQADLAAGDHVAIVDAGAYGAVMSSTYNARPLAAQAMVDGGRWHCIRARQPITELWRGEIIPPGLQAR